MLRSTFFLWQLCLKYPLKHRVLVGFLATFLREEGGFEFKKAITDCIVELMTAIPETKVCCVFACVSVCVYLCVSLCVLLLVFVCVCVTLDVILLKITSFMKGVSRSLLLHRIRV